jgi:hypothetical protein
MLLRQDVICAGPGPPRGGVHSATGYFEKQLRSQPGYDQDYLTNNKVARDERVDVLEELRFREPDHSFATCERHGFGYARIRRRDGVQGWIRCQYLREVCTEVEPAAIKKHQERERQRELEIDTTFAPAILFLLFRPRRRCFPAVNSAPRFSDIKKVRPSERISPTDNVKGYFYLRCTAVQLYSGL